MPSFTTIGCFVFALMLLMVTAPEVDAARKFDGPVEYAPLYVKGVTPDNVSRGELQKGLKAIYYLEYFERNLDGIPEKTSHSYPLKQGKPVAELNHQFGKENVFDSGTNRGVAMRLTGYLAIDQKGQYEFQALSNDGVTMKLADQVVIDDAEQHSDRLSNVGYVTIDQPGYYPLKVEYFQRKGTAALKLFWKTPGSEEFVPISSDSYVHLP